MASLEEITKDATVKGILPDALVTIVDVKWHGGDVVEAVYKGPDGALGNELLFRDREPTLEIVESGRPWSFTGDGNLLRLVSEAHRIHQVREDMERANARRLQPHFISSFFRDAFQHLGGTIREREPKRYEITRVPAVIRNRDRVIGTRETVLTKYERVTFGKSLIYVPGRPQASFICPGHPLLDATIDLILERYRDLLKQGAVLVNDGDEAQAPVYVRDPFEREPDFHVTTINYRINELLRRGAPPC